MMFDFLGLLDACSIETMDSLCEALDFETVQTRFAFTRTLDDGARKELKDKYGFVVVKDGDCVLEETSGTKVALFAFDLAAGVQDTQHYIARINETLRPDSKKAQFAACYLGLPSRNATAFTDGEKDLARALCEAGVHAVFGINENGIGPAAAITGADGPCLGVASLGCVLGTDDSRGFAAAHAGVALRFAFASGNPSNYACNCVPLRIDREKTRVLRCLLSDCATIQDNVEEKAPTCVDATRYYVESSLAIIRTADFRFTCDDVFRIIGAKPIPEASNYAEKGVGFARQSAEDCTLGDVLFLEKMSRAKADKQAQTAVKNGASLVVSERKLSAEIPHVVVKDAKKAFKALPSILRTTNIWRFTYRDLFAIVGAEDVPESICANQNAIPVSIELSKYAGPTAGDWSAYEGAYFCNMNYAKVGSEAHGKMLEIASNPENVIFSAINIPASDGSIVPTLKMKDPILDVYCRIATFIREVIPMPAASVTGSVGKSTTTQFLHSVMSEGYRVFVPWETGFRNANTPRLIMQTVLARLNSSYDFILLELGAGAPRLISSMAFAMKFEAFVVTNIDGHHQSASYGGAEGLVLEKTSYDRVPDHKGYAILNADEPLLMEREYNSNVITFGVTDQNADVVASDIKQSKDGVSFSLTQNGSSVPVTILIPGVHNAYNAAAAFAIARLFGLSDDQIVQGFAKYRSQGIRQALYRVDEKTLYFDCFSGSSRSIISACEALALMSTTGRKIAVVGGEGRSGKDSYSVNFQTGVELAKIEGIDLFIFVGLAEPDNPLTGSTGSGRAVYEGAYSVLGSEKTAFLACKDGLEAFLKTNTRAEDVILFEGSHHLGLHVTAKRVFDVDYRLSASDTRDSDNYDEEARNEARGLTAGEAIRSLIISNDEQNALHFGNNNAGQGAALQSDKGYIQSALALAARCYGATGEKTAQTIPTTRFHWDRDCGAFVSAKEANQTDSAVVTFFTGLNDEHLKSSILQSIAKVAAKADLAVGSLHSLSGETNDATLAHLGELGFDFLDTASPLLLEQSAAQAVSVMGACANANIAHGGLYLHEEQSRFSMFQVGDMRIAIIPFAEAASSHNNLSFAGKRNMLSLYGAEAAKTLASQARDAGADVVIAMCHLAPTDVKSYAAHRVRIEKTLRMMGVNCTLFFGDSLAASNVKDNVMLKSNGVMVKRMEQVSAHKPGVISFKIQRNEAGEISIQPMEAEKIARAESPSKAKEAKGAPLFGRLLSAFSSDR